MTPQDLVSALQDMNNEQGQQLVATNIPLFSNVALDRCVYLLKKEADRQWNHDAQRSLAFSGYLIQIGNLTNTTSYHALGMMTRGDALRRMDQDQASLPFFDAAGEEFSSLGDEIGWARTRIGRVSACLRLNRTTEALRDSELAHDIFMRHSKFLRAGQIDVNAAIINYELGQFDRAISLFDRAISTYSLVNSDSHVALYVARAHGNKALALAAQGKFREAIHLHEQAKAVFVAHGEKEEVSIAREDMNIAEIYLTQGHYSHALLLYNQSHALFLKHAMLSAASEVALQICSCLVHLNRMEEAYQLSEETVLFFRASPAQKHNLARALMLQATISAFPVTFSLSSERLLEASSLLEEGGFARLAALARLRRAELYFANHQLTASQREAEYVADIFADQIDLPHLAQAMLLQGRIADSFNDSQTAYDLCHQALDIARGQELLDLKYRCYDLLGQLAEGQQDLVRAADYYRQAVQGIEEVQARLILDERTSFLEDKASLYMRAITLSLHLQQPEQALIYVEKAKSGALGDYLRNTIDIRFKLEDQCSDDFLKHLTSLREEQAWFSSIAYATESDTNLTDTAAMRRLAVGGPENARREMHKRERLIEQLIEHRQLRTSGSILTRPRSSWTNSIVTSLWPRLDPDTLMIEYYVSGADITIFLLSRNGIHIHHVPNCVDKLKRLLSLWRTNLDLAGQAANSSDPQSSFANLQANCLGLLQRLHSILLAPVSSALTAITHLIIVPYGPLHYLPFHCLFDGEKFMIEQFVFSYLPSAALWDICRQRGARIRIANTPLQQSLVMGLSAGGRLTSAVQEAEVVASQLGVPCALDAEATSSLLMTMGSSSPIIHIAAHGLFRLDAPNFSYIQLADRQLSSIEAFNLELNACSLVVLSACETGRAVVSGIDEVIGLGRGFLYAGAASLLPTFWKIDDISSAELMEMFYRSLLHGNSKVMALASSQRSFLLRVRSSSASYRAHPYFWAPFHLIGDSAPLF